MHDVTNQISTEERKALDERHPTLVGGLAPAGNTGLPDAQITDLDNTKHRLLTENHRLHNDLNDARDQLWVAEQHIRVLLRQAGALMTGTPQHDSWTSASLFLDRDNNQAR